MAICGSTSTVTLYGATSNVNRQPILPSNYYPFVTVMEASTNVIKYSYLLEIDKYQSLQVAFSPSGLHMGLLTRNTATPYDIVYSTFDVVQGSLVYSMSQVEGLMWMWL